MINERNVNLCVSYLLKVFDYPDFIEWQNAKYDIRTLGDLEDEVKVMEVVMFASHAGNILRLAYYHLVHKQGIDVRYLADACVKVYVFQGIYQFQFEDHFKKGLFKKIINQTRYPFWTKFGLIGGGTKELADEGEKFSVYLDALKDSDN